MAVITQTPVYPGWRTVKAIGSGSYGTVYEIQRDVYGNTERAALKVITLPFSDSEVDYLRSSGMDDEKITRTIHAQVGSIANEYKLMSQIRDCSNVVRCDDFLERKHPDTIGWDIYIKMELLTPLLKRTDLISSEQQIIKLGKDLCRALIACQEHNIIHRDIKPQNIFISPKGEFKLGDFGIARNMDRTTNATVGIGTYSYMAPEVARGQAYGKTADIYSLGLVLYWCLNNRQGPFLSPGRIPTHEDNENAKNRRFAGEPLPTPVNGSDMLKRIVLKACAFDPRARYQSAAEFLAALNSLGEPVYYANNPQTNGMSAGAYDHVLHKNSTSSQTHNDATTPAKSNKKVLVIALCALLVISLFLAAVLPSLLNQDEESIVSDYASARKEKPTVKEENEVTTEGAEPPAATTLPVTPDSKVATTEQQLNTILENGNEAHLGADIRLGREIAIQGDTLDGNNHTIDAPDHNEHDPATENGITITGGTVKDLTVTSNYRAIGDRKGMGANSDVHLENVTVDGGSSYALNFGYGNGQATLYADNCTLSGWTSYTKFKEAIFTHCLFNWSANGSQGTLRPYVNTTLIGCTFREYVHNGSTKPFNLNFKNGTEGITVNFQDCYYEDTLITYDNVYSIFDLDPHANTIIIRNTPLNNAHDPFVGEWIPDNSSNYTLIINHDTTWSYQNTSNTYFICGRCSFNKDESALELFDTYGNLAMSLTLTSPTTLHASVTLESLFDEMTTTTFIKSTT